MDFIDDTAKVQKQFGLPLKARQIEDLWQHFRYFKWSDTAYSSFKQLVNKLSITVSSAGLIHASEVAIKLNSYLHEHKLVASIEQGAIDQFVANLCNLLKKPLTQTARENLIDPTPF